MKALNVDIQCRAESSYVPTDLMRRESLKLWRFFYLLPMPVL
jgi:hypothetical protein